MERLTWQELITQTVALMGNKEQNLFFPPFIATSAGNLASNFILNSLAEKYPNSQAVVDKARPFLKRKIVSVQNGIIELPTDYRYILSVGIAVTSTGNKPRRCADEEICQANDCYEKKSNENGELVNTTDPNSILYDASLASVRAEQCKFNQVDQVDVDQFFKATISKSRPPTLEYPIYCFVSRTQLKICPLDISHVEIIYLREPKKYNIGYKMMPDDTWQIDISSPFHVELEWEVNIAPEMFKAFTTLYAIHTRDGNLVNWNNELKQLGIT